MAQAADLERGNGQLREQSSRQADLLAASEAAKAELVQRVSEALVVDVEAVEARLRELVEPALQEYVADAIDTAELDRRKVAAREVAEEEHAPPSGLVSAYEAYEEAVEKRVAAEERMKQVLAEEDMAEAALMALLAAGEAHRASLHRK